MASAEVVEQTRVGLILTFEEARAVRDAIGPVVDLGDVFVKLSDLLDR